MRIYGRLEDKFWEYLNDRFVMHHRGGVGEWMNRYPKAMVWGLVVEFLETEGYYINLTYQLPAEWYVAEIMWEGGTIDWLVRDNRSDLYDSIIAKICFREVEAELS